MADPRLIFTQHAEAMLIERGISREWVERAIIAPDALVPDATRPNVMRALLQIPERGGRFCA